MCTFKKILHIWGFGGMLFFLHKFIGDINYSSWLKFKIAFKGCSKLLFYLGLRSGQWLLPWPPPVLMPWPQRVGKRWEFTGNPKVPATVWIYVSQRREGFLRSSQPLCGSCWVAGLRSSGPRACPWRILGLQLSLSLFCSWPWGKFKCLCPFVFLPWRVVAD